MTTGFDHNNNEEAPVQRRGFWGQPLVNKSEHRIPDEPQNTDDEEPSAHGEDSTQRREQDGSKAIRVIPVASESEESTDDLSDVTVPDFAEEPTGELPIVSPPEELTDDVAQPATSPANAYDDYPVLEWDDEVEEDSVSLPEPAHTLDLEEVTGIGTLDGIDEVEPLFADKFLDEPPIEQWSTYEPEPEEAYEPASAYEPEPEEAYEPASAYEPSSAYDPEEAYEPEGAPEAGSASEGDFFGGTPSAYSDYILDSPAYEQGSVAARVPEVDEPATKNPEKGNIIRMIAVVASVLIALGVVYALGVMRFSDRYLPNTSINGCDVSGLTVEEAQHALEQQTANYSCEVRVGDFSYAVQGKDISMDRDEQTMASTPIQGQSAFFWPVALIIPNSMKLEASVTFDTDAAKQSLVTAVEEYNQKTLPSEGIGISYDESTGTYSLKGTTQGTAVDPTAVANYAVGDIRSFAATSNPTESDATHEATAKDIPSFAHVVDNANRVRTSDVAITVNNEPVVTSEADQNAQWISVSVDGDPKIVVDEEAVRFWAQAYVADAVYHSDDWSNYYLNEDAFVEGFCKRLSEGNVDPYEAPTYDELRTEGESREKAYAKGGWDSKMGRYIDVDLESQFARLFDEKGNVIWESAFVSGSMYEGHPTVTGDFQIYAMQTNTTLVGMDYNGDGYPDYESFVSYWMPFYGGYGLHDATWRYNFGGENYYYDGSHGCVNLPYSKAEELYGITYVGETVHVHW